MCAGAWAAPEDWEEGCAWLVCRWILQTSSPAAFEKRGDTMWARVLVVLSLSPSHLACWMLPQGRRRLTGCGTSPGG